MSTALPKNNPNTEDLVTSEVTLDQICPQAPGNQEIMEHWLQLRGDDRIASWLEFDPLDIAEVLTNCVIVQTKPDDHYVIQLFGSAMAEQFGRDLTGMDLADIYGDEYRERIGDRMDIVKHTPAVLLLTSQLQMTAENWLQFEFLGIPFSSNAKDVDHLLLSTLVLEEKPPGDERVCGVAPQRRTLEILVAAL